MNTFFLSANSSVLMTVNKKERKKKEGRVLEGVYEKERKCQRGQATTRKMMGETKEPSITCSRLTIYIVNAYETASLTSP